MVQSQLFSSAFEVAPFVTSSGLLKRSWDVITSNIVSNVGVGISWKLSKEPDTDVTIIAFDVTSPADSSNLQADLVSSSELRDNNFLQFDFLCTKRNPLFSLNRTTLSLFFENHQRLDQLKSEISSSPLLIITGLALGGSIASLFTLSLLDSIDLKKKRPLCITFGSPLIGDKKLQEAISRSSTWNSCFLHVVSSKDPLPRKFITNNTAPASVLSPHTISSYMPFGTFLLCSDAYSTCFENPDSILVLLETSIYDQNQLIQSVNYGDIVEHLNRRAICKDFTAQAEGMTHSNSLHACISLQLCALGLTPHMQQQQQQNIDINTLVTKTEVLGLTPHMQQQQQQNIDINTLVTKMEKLEKKFIVQKGKAFDPSRKLNVMKIDMAQLEWYKKNSKNRDIGYYDSYKSMLSTSDQDVVKFRKNLTNYWKEMVEEAEMKPQKEGAAFRTRWLYAGTNYRRMVEPLDIAEYYKNGGTDYVDNERSEHFKQLEKWLIKGATTTGGTDKATRDNVESILTLDSCFWAHVEEALLLCNVLRDVQSSDMEKEEAIRKLLEFEKYVYELLKNYAVSPEIFLRETSYMTWWNQYKAIKGTSYSSELSCFMSNADNYNVQYVGGTYNFN